MSSKKSLCETRMLLWETMGMGCAFVNVPRFSEPIASNVNECDVRQGQKSSSFKDSETNVDDQCKMIM